MLELVPGLVFGLASMLASGIAIVLLKKGLDHLPSDPGKNVVKISLLLFKNKWWFTGGCLLVLGWLCRFMAIRLSDLSYVRMLYASHLLIVVIGSRWIVKEKLTPTLICSICIILSGLLFVTASPPLTRTSIGNIQNYIIFFTVMISLLATALVITFFIKRTKNIFFALCSAFSYGLGATTQGVFAVNVLDISSLASISFYLSLLVEPLFYIMILFSLGGYVFGNLMAYKFKLSLTYSIQYPLSEVIVLVGSVVIFNEDLSFVTNPNRIIGILLLMAGLVVVVMTQRKYLAPPILIARP